MSDRILVAHASRRGSTREVAEEIAAVFTAAGMEVDVRPVGLVTDLAGYRAVVLGSSVRRHGFLPEAVSFVRRYREELSRMPVAYFSVSGLLKTDTPKNRQTAAHFVDKALKAAPEVAPVAMGAFAGRYEAPAMCPFMRLVTALGWVRSGDWRDWNTIRTWAESVRSVLAPAA